MNSDFLKNLKVITRVEFIPANSASVILGYAWAIGSRVPFTLNTLGFLLVLFFVLSSVGTIGAHWNSYGDYELDADDPVKTELHNSMLAFGKTNLLKLILVEAILAISIFISFWYFHQNAALLGIWCLASFLAFAYSMPPLRFKARNILAFLSLCLVLSVLPVLFVYLSTNSLINPIFLSFLVGHTLVIYSLIIPTEIRDYQVDSQHHVSTLTVWMGLKRACLVAMVMMITGSLMVIGSYIANPFFITHPIFLPILAIIMVANGFVFTRFLRILQWLRKDNEKEGVHKAIELAAQNPKWITISSMASLVVALVFLIGKTLI